MKKYVLFTDSQMMSENTQAFIKQLNNKEAFLLTGAFFPAINYDLFIPNAFATSGVPYVSTSKVEHDKIRQAIHQFTTFCTNNQIEYRLHKYDEEWDVNAMITESRFADMVLVNGQSFFSNSEPDQPNHFLKEILSRSESPVLVLPGNIKEVTRIIAAYDGSKESMQALKKLSEAIPAYTNIPLEITYWTDDNEKEIPNLEYLEEFVPRHFAQVNIKKQYFDTQKYLSSWLEASRNTLFVSGSYSRSTISSWFKKSFIEDILRHHSAAVFVAHAN